MFGDIINKETKLMEQPLFKTGMVVKMKSGSEKMTILRPDVRGFENIFMGLWYVQFFSKVVYTNVDGSSVTKDEIQTKKVHQNILELAE